MCTRVQQLQGRASNTSGPFGGQPLRLLGGQLRRVAIRPVGERARVPAHHEPVRAPVGADVVELRDETRAAQRPQRVRLRKHLGQV